MNSNAFQVLAAFLEKFGNEVEGRELDEPPEQTKNRLQQLAVGELSSSHWKDLLAELQRHPQWQAWLAREVKALRATEHPG